MAVIFNSIQNRLFSTQHVVNTIMFSCMRVLKMERAEDNAYVGSFHILIM